ncbi:MAG: hypothetical protein ACE5E5_09035 [Phycisphaerae bacterium]
MAETAESSDLLRPVRIGIVLSILSILLGFGLGGVFGGFEREAKEFLEKAASSVDSSVYASHETKSKKVIKKAWGYVKRSHMHGGAIGATALALSLMLAFCDRSRRFLRGLVAAALGAGSFGYSMYWLLAAIKTARMGSPGPAKASLEWLAVPSAGLLIVGVVAALALIVRQTFCRCGAKLTAEDETSA